MAIPILQGSLDTQIKSPQVAGGQALDLSEQIGASLKQASQAVKQTSESIKDVLQIRQDARDQEKADLAYTTYMQGLHDLNVEMESKQGVNKLAFQEEYAKRANSLHDGYLGALRTIKNSQIREQNRQQINSVNLSNRSTSALSFEKAKLETENEAYENFATEFINNNPLTTPTGNFEIDNNNLNESKKILFNRAYQQGISNGWTPERLNTELRNKQTALVQGVFMKMINTARTASGFQGYQYALEFLREHEIEMNKETYHELANKYEKEMLATEVVLNSNNLLDNNGNVDYNKIDSLVKELSVQERLQLIKNVQNKKNGNGGNLSSEEARGLLEIEDSERNRIYKELRNVGLSYLLDEKSLQRLGEFASKKDAINNNDQILLRKDPNKFNKGNLRKIIASINSVIEGQYVFSPEGEVVLDENGQYVRANNNNMKALQSQGYIIKKMTPSDELLTLRAALSNMYSDAPSTLDTQVLSSVKPTLETVVENNAVDLIAGKKTIRQRVGKMFPRVALALNTLGIHGFGTQKVPGGELVSAVSYGMQSMQQQQNVLGLSSDSVADDLSEDQKNQLGLAFWRGTIPNLNEAQRNAIYKELGIDKNLSEDQKVDLAAKALSKDFFNLHKQEDSLTRIVNTTSRNISTAMAMPYYLKMNKEGKLGIGIVPSDMFTEAGRITGDVSALYENTTNLRKLKEGLPAEQLQEMALMEGLQMVNAEPSQELNLVNNGVTIKGTGDSIVSMKNLGLNGIIGAGNSVPKIALKNAYNLKMLDNYLANSGYEVIYTSAMGGKHSAGPKGHYAGNKVDFQLMRNGQFVQMGQDELNMLQNAGFFGEGTGAVGWEANAKQQGGGHYDFTLDFQDNPFAEPHNPEGQQWTADNDIVNMMMEANRTMPDLQLVEEPSKAEIARQNRNIPSRATTNISRKEAIDFTKYNISDSQRDELDRNVPFSDADYANMEAIGNLPARIKNSADYKLYKAREAKKNRQIEEQKNQSFLLGPRNINREVVLYEGNKEANRKNQTIITAVTPEVEQMQMPVYGAGGGYGFIVGGRITTKRGNL